MKTRFAPAIATGAPLVAPLGLPTSGAEAPANASHPAIYDESADGGNWNEHKHFNAPLH
jgi:hypothetical protein